MFRYMKAGKYKWKKNSTVFITWSPFLMLKLHVKHVMYNKMNKIKFNKK